MSTAPLSLARRLARLTLKHSRHRPRHADDPGPLATRAIDICYESGNAQEMLRHFNSMVRANRDLAAAVIATMNYHPPESVAIADRTLRGTDDIGPLFIRAGSI